MTFARATTAESERVAAREWSLTTLRKREARRRSVSDQLTRINSPGSTHEFERFAT